MIRRIRVRVVVWALALVAVGLAIASATTATTNTAATARAKTRATATATATRPKTIVSLEFDHAFTDQLPGIALAAEHGMHVTVFAMSGRVGTPTYMTIAQLQALQAAGDEIGGHTINHPDLAELSDSAAREEVCGDRAALQADGLDVTDFAYPYGEFNNATPAIVRSCGYQSARGVGGVEPQGGCYDICLYAETVPPAEPFDTRTENSVLYSTTLSTIEGYVIHAERAGGWVQIIFHYVCDRCNEYSVSEPTLAAFLNWLAPRSAQGTVVETVRQVIQTPFVPAAVLVLAPHAPPLHLLASRSCPATPVTARCAAIPGRRVSAIRLGPREPLRLATAPATENIRLRQRHHGVLAAKRTSAASAGGAVRWRLPATCERHGEATIAVHYPLGVAYYRFRLAPCAAARRRQS